MDKYSIFPLAIIRTFAIIMEYKTVDHLANNSDGGSDR